MNVIVVVTAIRDARLAAIVVFTPGVAFVLYDDTAAELH
jgi:hypothetical protein